MSDATAAGWFSHSHSFIASEFSTPALQDLSERARFSLCVRSRQSHKVSFPPAPQWVFSSAVLWKR